MKSIYSDMTPEDAVELAFLSSNVHKKGKYETYKYEGMKYKYKGFATIHDKKYWKKELKTDFHVVFMPANPIEKKAHGQLDRFMIISEQFRNAFMLFNVHEDKKIVNVTLFHDDLFRMHKFLIEKGYDMKHPNNR